MIPCLNLRKSRSLAGRHHHHHHHYHLSSTLDLSTFFIESSRVKELLLARPVDSSSAQSTPRASSLVLPHPLSVVESFVLREHSVHVSGRFHSPTALRCFSLHHQNRRHECDASVAGVDSFLLLLSASLSPEHNVLSHRIFDSTVETILDVRPVPLNVCEREGLGY